MKSPSNHHFFWLNPINSDKANSKENNPQHRMKNSTFAEHRLEGLELELSGAIPGDACALYPRAGDRQGDSYMALGISGSRNQKKKQRFPGSSSKIKSIRDLFSVLGLFPNKGQKIQNWMRST